MASTTDSAGQGGATPSKPGSLAIQELQTLQRKGQSARSRFESTWYLNLAYYAGHQWLYWNRGRLAEPVLENWRVTFTDNRIIGIVRTELAKMTKQRPIFQATPTTGSDEDVTNAQMAERLLYYLWGHLHLQRKQRAALMWSRVCGIGYWKIYWDSTAGDDIELIIGPDGQPIKDPAGAPLKMDDMPPEAAQQMEAAGLKTKRIYMGEVCVDVKSPWELIVDPLAGDEGLEAAEWVIEDSVKSKDSLVKKYGSVAKGLKEDADAIVGIAESRMSFTYSPDGGSQYQGVRVFEYWSKATSKYPEGKHIVWAQQTILVDEDNPYDECCLPYIAFNGIPVPGRFYPTSVTEQLRNPQTEFNKTRSQIRENAARIGNPALLVSRFANVDYRGVPGERIDFDDTMQNAVPQYLQPPEMPAYVREEPAMIESSFREISGQHETTNGTVPAGVTAASAINLLQEQDDTRLGPDIYDMERSLALAGEMLCMLVAKYYSDERTVRLAGDDGDWDIFSFKGEMLKGYCHIDVQAGSALPHSKAAKQASMHELLQLFIQNQVPLSRRELAKYLKDMEVGGFEKLIEQFSADEQQINRENRQLDQGQPLNINLQDDDEAHIDGHKEHMKSTRYMALTQQNPGVAQVFTQHLQMHMQRDAQATQQQMQAQIQPQMMLEQAKGQTQVQVAQQQAQVDAQSAHEQAQIQAQSAVMKGQADAQALQAKTGAQIAAESQKAQLDQQLAVQQAQVDQALQAKQQEMQAQLEQMKTQMELMKTELQGAQDMAKQRLVGQQQMALQAAKAQADLQKAKIAAQAQKDRAAQQAKSNPSGGSSGKSA